MKLHKGMIGMSSKLISVEFSERIERAFQLLPAYAHLTGVPVNEIQSFAEKMLDLSNISAEDSPGFSCLNGDQSPLQMCIKFASNGISFRLIADPASDEPVLSRRFLRARSALLNTLKLTQTCGLRTIAEELLTTFGPQNPQHLDKFTWGVFWHAASISVPGVAIYVDTCVNSDEDVWGKIGQWFSSSTPARSEKVIEAIDTFRPYCRVSSVGIEGIDRNRTRIKLYMRTFREMPNGLFGNLFPPISELAKSGCLRLIMGDFGLSPANVLFNIGLHAESGELVNAKIDLSGTALGIKPENVDQVVSGCGEALNISVIPLSNLMKNYNLEVSFISVGIDINKEKNINLYLRGGY